MGFRGGARFDQGAVGRILTGRGFGGDTWSQQYKDGGAEGGANDSLGGELRWGADA